MEKDSARRPGGREDDERRVTEDAAMTALEATLEERGWTPRRWDENFGRHWEAASTDGTHDVWAYPAEGPGAPREALCHVVAAGSETGMWFLGVPSPAEAARLTAERWYLVADHRRADGQRVVDLQTAGVLAQKDAHLLLRDPARTIEQAQRQGEEYERFVRGHEETLRRLAEGGWNVRGIELGLGYGGDETTVQVDADADVEQDEWGVGYCLTIRPRKWLHFVEGLGVKHGVYLHAPTGATMSADSAIGLLRKTRERERIGEEFELYEQMRADLGPDEVPPSPEEVRAQMKRLREESRRFYAAGPFGHRRRTAETFGVDYEPGPKGE